MVRTQMRQRKWRINPRDNEQVKCCREMIEEKSHRLMNLRGGNDVIVVQNEDATW